MFLLWKADTQLPALGSHLEEGWSPPLLEASDCGPTFVTGAASGQVIKVHIRDWVSPVTKGAELWAWKGRILLLIEKWEHMFNKLTQPVVPRRRDTRYKTVGCEAGYSDSSQRQAESDLNSIPGHRLPLTHLG
jgi:hypothetical protein